jgi:hypothetical protein
MTSYSTSEESVFIDRIDVVRTTLQAFYREVEKEIAQEGPICLISGRCCRFEEYGHVLFVSAPEAILLVADSPAPVRVLDDKATCPWQDLNGRCTARTARPLGCRFFFCDPSFEARMPELAEKWIGRLKLVAEEHNWPWEYAPLHVNLHRALADGRLESDGAGDNDRPKPLN